PQLGAGCRFYSQKLQREMSLIEIQETVSRSSSQQDPLGGVPVFGGISCFSQIAKLAVRPFQRSQIELSADHLTNNVDSLYSAPRETQD
ncbi:hypothetical protein KUCAC02_024232, partial [Chaenocephalus aceratus]